ncbi:MAG: hypothetical protein ACI8ZB_005334 [Desulforhopalus sp.]|jgi:hypothetical protein
MLEMPKNIIGIKATFIPVNELKDYFWKFSSLRIDQGKGTTFEKGKI